MNTEEKKSAVVEIPWADVDHQRDRPGGRPPAHGHHEPALHGEGNRIRNYIMPFTAEELGRSRNDLNVLFPERDNDISCSGSVRTSFSDT